MLRLYREHTARSIRECAEEVGVTRTTFHRAEQNSLTMNAGNFLKFLAWMLGPPSRGRDRR
jgi:hypothetical protein